MDLTNSAIEWIVVNKSSQNLIVKSDNSLELLNSGKNIFDAMNIGLINASGELIIFMNAGDSFYEKTIPNAIISSYLENNWAWAIGKTIRSDASLWDPKTLSKLKFQFGLNSYCHQSTVYQTKLLREFHGFDDDSLVSDWIMSLRISKKIKPFLDSNIWSCFETNGISSRIKLLYKYREYSRLKKKYDLSILPFPVESAIQLLFLIASYSRKYLNV
jgi:hypothetical protein